LEALAQVLVQDVGALYAINMDGGGSSTMIRGFNYKVTNRPTCLDVPFQCQRPVATVLCVSSSVTHASMGTLHASSLVSSKGDDNGGGGPD
jgi:hypothetical protein